jgi:hypothetical protein
MLSEVLAETRTTPDPARRPAREVAGTLAILSDLTVGLVRSYGRELRGLDPSAHRQVLAYFQRSHERHARALERHLHVRGDRRPWGVNPTGTPEASPGAGHGQGLAALLLLERRLEVSCRCARDLIEDATREAQLDLDLAWILESAKAHAVYLEDEIRSGGRRR